MKIPEVSIKLQNAFEEFKIGVKVTHAVKGPTVTLFMLKLEPGIKLSKVTGLEDNIALSIGVESVRVFPIPEKSVIGVEVPNTERETVPLRSIITNPDFVSSQYELPIALGKSNVGEIVVEDLAQTPHLLIAGATGTGKSVCVNSIISSLIAVKSYKYVRFLMIDPKMVELKQYNSIPHLLTPVLYDPRKTAPYFEWLIGEMERRYALLERSGCRNLKGYNKQGHTLPYIVLVIDEFADLMAVSKRQVEGYLTRLAAMSRAVGIHLLLATQRPSVDVITGVIKANFPSRISFKVASKVDSRTVLDYNGAEILLGKGDMLYQSSTNPTPVRIQGAYYSDNEIIELVDSLSINKSSKIRLDKPASTLIHDAIQVVLEHQKVSRLLLQNELGITKDQAEDLLEQMENLSITRNNELVVRNW